MHQDESVQACAQIIHHNADAFGEPLQPANRRRLQYVEDTKKYKASQKRFPSQRNRDQGDQLTRYLIDDDELRVFEVGGASDSCCSRDTD